MSDIDPRLIWARSPPAEPLLPLSIQPPLAVIGTIVALAAAGSFIVTGKRSVGAAAFWAVVSSVAGGLSVVFIVNAVHVYTG